MASSWALPPRNITMYTEAKLGLAAVGPRFMIAGHLQRIPLRIARDHATRR